MLDIESQSGLPWGLALSDLARYPEALSTEEHGVIFSVYNQGFSPEAWPKGPDEAILVQSSRLYILMTRTQSVDAFASTRMESVAERFATNNFKGEIDWPLIGSLSLGLS